MNHSLPYVRNFCHKNQDLPAKVSKDNNNHRKEKKDKPDYGNGPFGAPVKEDGNNEQNNGGAKPKEAPTFEVSIDWKLEAERRAWLAALREDICPDTDSDISEVV